MMGVLAGAIACALLATVFVLTYRHKSCDTGCAGCGQPCELRDKMNLHTEDKHV